MRRVRVVALLALVCVASATDRKERLDLKHLLTSYPALREVVITHITPTEKQAMFVYGTGKLVLQPLMMNGIRASGPVPACIAFANPDEVKAIVKMMIDRHFLDLPVRSYVVMEAALQDDPLKDLQLHTIRVATDEGFAERTFGTGMYGNERLNIPPDFAAIEKMLTELRARNFPAGEKWDCRIAPAVQFRK